MYTTADVITVSVIQMRFVLS